MGCSCGHPGAENFALDVFLMFDVMMWRDARRIPPPRRRWQVAVAVVVLAPVVVILLDLFVPPVP
jgi:hypothetical protein